MIRPVVVGAVKRGFGGLVQINLVVRVRSEAMIVVEFLKEGAPRRGVEREGGGRVVVVEDGMVNAAVAVVGVV
jgi:hypothetical protein